MTPLSKKSSPYSPRHANRGSTISWASTSSTKWTPKPAWTFPRTGFHPTTFCTQHSPVSQGEFPGKCLFYGVFELSILVPRRLERNFEPLQWGQQREPSSLTANIPNSVLALFRIRNIVSHLFQLFYSTSSSTIRVDHQWCMFLKLPPIRSTNFDLESFDSLHKVFFAEWTEWWLKPAYVCEEMHRLYLLYLSWLEFGEEVNCNLMPGYIIIFLREDWLVVESSQK